MTAIPQRIVSLLPAATEMLYAVGAGDRIVGISHECIWPSEVEGKPRVTRSNVDSAADSAAIDRQVQTLMRQGAALYSVNEELLGALAPDLVVTQSQCDVCAVRYEDVVQAIEKHAALQRAEILTLNPQSIADVLSDLVRVGEAAGYGQSARDVNRQLLKRIEAVQSVAESFAVDQRPRVAVVEWTDPLMIAANWTPELVEMAGGQYGLAEARRHSQYATWDDVRSYDPECLVIAPCGFQLPRAIEETRHLASLADWRQLAAVRMGQVFAVDGDAYFNRPGPRLVETLELLATLLHSSHFPEVAERFSMSCQAVCDAKLDQLQQPRNVAK